MSKMYSPRQVAEQLGISTETVRRLIREGRMQAMRVSERCLAVSEAALAAYLEAHTTTIGD